mgnify:CR=1 FL=1
MPKKRSRSPKKQQPNGTKNNTSSSRLPFAAAALIGVLAAAAAYWRNDAEETPWQPRPSDAYKPLKRIGGVLIEDFVPPRIIEALRAELEDAVNRTCAAPTMVCFDPARIAVTWLACVDEAGRVAPRPCEILFAEIFARGHERRDAATIQPLRKTGNLLLCTLLLGNTLVNAAIATLLADATAGVLGMFITTGLIVVFGEIVPQSVCSRYALQVYVYAYMYMCNICMNVFQ